MKLVLCIGYSQSLRCTQGLQKQQLCLLCEAKSELSFLGRRYFHRSVGSFFIGVVSRAPAMEKLCFQRGSAEELWGKELEKPNKIPQLGTALLYKTSLQPELERTALTAELERTALTANSNLQQQELVAAYASELAIQTQSLQEKELSAAYATALPTELDRTALAMELESTALTLSTLKQKKLRRL